MRTFIWTTVCLMATAYANAETKDPTVAPPALTEAAPIVLVTDWRAGLSFDARRVNRQQDGNAYVLEGDLRDLANVDEPIPATFELPRDNPGIQITETGQGVFAIVSPSGEQYELTIVESSASFFEGTLVTAGGSLVQDILATGPWSLTLELDQGSLPWTLAQIAASEGPTYNTCFLDAGITCLQGDSSVCCFHWSGGDSPSCRWSCKEDDGSCNDCHAQPKQT